MDSGLLKGTLKTLVMNILEDAGPIHGYGIRQEIEKRTDRKVLITEGALYPLLKKLEEKGLVETKNESSGKRVRKLYSLNQLGSQELETQNIELLDFAGTLIQFIHTKPSMSV